MTLHSRCLRRVKVFEYLGVRFKNGNCLGVDTSPSIRNCYACSNSILRRSIYIDDMAKLYLIESKCMPLLTYALPGLKLTNIQMKELNKAWNCIYRKLFGFNVWESVKVFIAGLGKLNYAYTKLKPTVNFLRCNLDSTNRTLKYIITHNVFSTHLMHCATRITLNVTIRCFWTMACRPLKSILWL